MYAFEVVLGSGVSYHFVGFASLYLAEVAAEDYRSVMEEYNVSILSVKVFEV